MTYDLVIRNGTVVDGSGLGSYRADVGVVGDRIAAVGPDPRAGRRRRSTPRATSSPRVHRRPHPHGRPGLLGRHRIQLVLARRDLGGHGQLRLHPGPGPVRPAGPGGPQPRAGRGHRPGRPGRRHRLELRDLPRVPRRRRPAAQGHQLRGQRRPLGPAHLGHGRAGLRGGGHRRRPGRHGGPAGRRRCGPGPSASPRRAPSTTRPRTTGRWPRGWRRGTRWSALVGVMGDLGHRASSRAPTPACRPPTPSVRRRPSTG